MNMQVSMPSGQPVVFERDGSVFASSRDVASYFEKRHDHVMRDIDRLVGQEPSLAEGGLPNFGETPYIEPNTGQTYRSYVMTRDGFTLLAMGFTGAKALKWKLAYIQAFNQMEAALRDRPAQIDVRDPSQLANIAVQLIEVNKELETRARSAEAQVEAAKPKARFYDQFASAEGLYGLQNAGRVLNESPNKFVSWLKQKYLFYQGGSLVPRAVYRDRGLFEVKATIIEDKARYRTYVTPKGLRYFAEKLGKPHPDGLLSE